MSVVDGWLGSLAIPPAILRNAVNATEELRSLTGLYVDAGELITGRARLLGITPRGQISAGGATRLMPTLDGWCAFTLSRRDDVEAVPALIEEFDAPTDPWLALRHWASTTTTDLVLERARLLDVPVAALGETGARPPRVRPWGTPGPPREAAGLLVADLTSMWAGPLCGQLLAQAGATVVKVESPHRPDGTRTGHPNFFDWMNGGKLSYAIDFDQDIARVRALLLAADVILEGSRPIALSLRGAGPADMVGRPGRVWLSISGYGTHDDDGRRIAFGDDAAVAGGLVSLTSDGPTFVGDAIANPLSGITAATTVFGALARGGGELIEVAMAEVAASYAMLPAIDEYPPARRVQAPGVMTARELGADNDVVARLLTERSSASC